MISNETIILPEAIAESVVGELARHLHFNHNTELQDTAQLVSKLVDKAEAYYIADSKFRSKVKRDNTYGRDWLYTFMRHWLSSELLPLLRGGKIPVSFSNGQAI